MFTLTDSNITLNEPVFVDFSVRNTHSETIYFDLGHNRKSHFVFTIAEPGGAVVRAPRLSEEGLGLIGEVSLSPGEKYTQRLVVNEWYPFSEPGDYVIDVKLVSPVVSESGAVIEPGPSGSLSLHVDPRNPTRLRQVSDSLYRQATESSDGEQRLEAAIALSYMRDPIVVSYLERGLSDERLAWQYAIPGLARIANIEAIYALITLVQRNDPESGSALARFVLSYLKEKVQDPILKETIEAALQ
jgi:hypothetical protein